MHKDSIAFKRRLQVASSPLGITAIESVERKNISFCEAMKLTDYLEIRDAREPSGWRRLFAPKRIVTGNYAERKEFFKGL